MDYMLDPPEDDYVDFEDDWFDDVEIDTPDDYTDAVYAANAASDWENTRDRY